jgi:hypothetical protein
MKKLITLIAVLMLVNLAYVSQSYAQLFNFGQDTYSKWANILVVNSLGDRVEESKFIHNGLNLGYNDFIPENAFKNDLYNQGYTQVFDYNNSSLDLVEVGYMGLKGDPRSYDADYVLREEYEKYSNQYQDIRIDENKNNIVDVDKKHTIWNEKQDTRLDDIDIHNDYQDMRLDANKDNILKNRKQINDVDDKHTNWNNDQDDKINQNESNILKNTSNITNNTNRINDLDNRVNKLEKTHYIVGGAIRIVDSKKWNVELFADYSTNRQKIDRTGIKFTLKIGTSYTEQRIEELEAKLNKLLDQ